MQSNKTQTTCLLVLAVVALGVLLIYTRSAMIPFVLSIFLAFVLAPIVKFFERMLFMPRRIALALTFLLLFGIMTACFVAVVGKLQVALSGISTYQEQLRLLAQEAHPLLEKWSIDTRALNVDQIITHLTNLPVFGYFRSLAGGLLSFTTTILLVLIFTAFLLSGESFSVPEDHVLGQVESKIRLYLLTKILTSSVTGILTTVFLSLLNVNMAVMFGIFAFLLNFIPNIGSIIATLLPIPVALLPFEGFPHLLAVIILPGSCQFIIGNVVEPKLMGQALDLHPVTTLLALMFWGLIWGVPGMFLAVPLTAILKSILSEIETTKPWAELMAGRVTT